MKLDGSENDSISSSKFFEVRGYDRIKLKESEDGTAAVDVLVNMRHKNIVKVHEVIDVPEKQKTYIVTDSLPGGTLQKII